MYVGLKNEKKITFLHFMIIFRNFARKIKAG